jgi:hypothetical protein
MMNLTLLENVVFKSACGGNATILGLAHFSRVTLKCPACDIGAKISRCHLAIFKLIGRPRPAQLMSGHQAARQDGEANSGAALRKEPKR